MTASLPMGSPSLSILIPAYEFSSGIVRILQSLLDTPTLPLEILIHDDSSSGAVEEAARPWVQRFPSVVSYRRNSASQGAVSNWNGLLAAAKGDYLILLHHDELPLTPAFVPALWQDLEAAGWPDAYVLDVVIAHEERPSVRHHFPLWTKRLLVRLAPEHLYLRNIIGAPSALVVKRDRCLAFEPSLRWLVDVDWYVRIFRTTRRVACSRHLVIASIEGGNETITRTLASDLEAIQRAEVTFLRQRGPDNWALRCLEPGDLTSRLAALLEKAAWIAFRGPTRLWAATFPARPEGRMLAARLPPHGGPSPDGEPRP